MTHPPQHKLPRRFPLLAIVVSAIVLAVAAIVVGFFILGSGRAGDVLEGPSVHNFGVIVLDGYQPQTLSGTVTLANRSPRPVEVQDVRTTCNCLKADAQPGVIEPGGTFDVDVELIVENEGVTGAAVVLALDRLRIHRFAVEATARPRFLLAPAGELVYTNEEDIAEVLIHMRRFDDREPENLEWYWPPAGGGDELETDVTFLGWKKIGEANLDADEPALWQAKYHVRVIFEELQPVPLEFFAGRDQMTGLFIAPHAMRPSEPGDRILRRRPRNNSGEAADGME